MVIGVVLGLGGRGSCRAAVEVLRCGGEVLCGLAEGVLCVWDFEPRKGTEDTEECSGWLGDFEPRMTRMPRMGVMLDCQ